MWNKNKSIILTHLLVRASYVFLAITAIGLPILFKISFVAFETIADQVIYSLLAVVPAGYTALVCLDKLLINVKKEMVFSEKNVKFLRIISWACFYAGIVGLITLATIFFNTHKISIDVYFTFLILALAVGEMFMGLVVRVVKNVFEKAIEIKEENELTI